MCRPIKGADQQTNHVVLRTGKVLATTRAHLSYMELMAVLSFSGLRAVVCVVEASLHAVLHFPTVFFVTVHGKKPSF